MEKAGIKDAEILIAVTENDEVNIIACEIAKRYGVAHKIAQGQWRILLRQ